MRRLNPVSAPIGVSPMAQFQNAGVVELADTLDLGSRGVNRAGSSPVASTIRGCDVVGSIPDLRSGRASSSLVTRSTTDVSPKWAVVK